MTYEQVKKQVLQLLNQYTIAGTEVSSSYNNQEDYLLRIPGLVNDAMMEIATTAKKIPATIELTELDGEVVGDKVRFELPEDFYQFKTGDTFALTTDDGHYFHTNLYNLQGKQYLLIPLSEMDRGVQYTVTYYRYPQLLPDDPNPNIELDNTVDTHYAIPFYVAAFLVIHDDNFQFASYYNKYEDKLQKMSPGVSVEMTSATASDGGVFVGDGYGMGYFWG